MTHGSHETGYTDEVGVEVHDLIHNAEVEEQKLHGKDALCADDPGPAESSELGNAPKDKPSKAADTRGPLDKVKDALHIKK